MTSSTSIQRPLSEFTIQLRNYEPTQLTLITLIKRQSKNLIQPQQGPHTTQPQQRPHTTQPQQGPHTTQPQQRPHTTQPLQRPHTIQPQQSPSQGQVQQSSAPKAQTAFLSMFPIQRTVQSFMNVMMITRF